MFEREKQVLYAKESIDNFKKMAGLTNATETCNLVIDTLLQEKTRRMTAAGFFAFASSNLTKDEREGLVYFTALILHSDDILDSAKHTPDNPQELVETLLRAPVKGSQGELRGSEIYLSMMRCFPDNKREMIKSYLVQMTILHAGNDHLGKPGEYDFKKARDYKYTTNIPSFVTGLRLAESTIQADNFTTLFIAGQYIDDLKDWPEDTDNLNMFIGMANQVWRQKNCLHWQDFDYLVESTYLSKPEEVIKNSQMIDTRTAYRRAFFKEFEGREKVPMAGMLKLSGALIL